MEAATLRIRPEREGALALLAHVVKEKVSDGSFAVKDRHVGSTGQTRAVPRTCDRSAESDLIELRGDFSFLTDKAVRVKRRYLYDEETCPSKHQNNGEDVCSDCGIRLN